MMSFRRVLTVAAVASFALAACGGNKPAPPPPPPGDSGTRDSAGDSATDSATDSGLDGGLDSATRDGGAGEAFPGCTETIFEEIDLGSDVRGFQQTVSVAPAASSWGLAWSDASDSFENIRARVVPTRGSLGSTHDVTTGAPSARHASILSLGSSFLTIYYDNSDTGAGFEVFVRALDSSGLAVGTPTRLTMNAVRDDNPVLLRMGSSNLAVWVEDNVDRVAKSAIISDTGDVIGGIQTLTIPPESPSQFVLSALDGGAGMAWTENRDGASDLVLVRLDARGMRVPSSKITVSTEHDASGSVDLATNSSTGGAATFDVSVSGSRPQVRFRQIGADGSLLAPEHTVTLTPALGRDPSIASLAGGYVVAYRALPDGTISEPTLRLTLLDARGEVLRSFDGPGISAVGGRTTVRVAADGRLLVAWEDLDASGVGRRIRALRVRCAADGPAFDGGLPDASMPDGGMDASVIDAGMSTCPILATCVGPSRTCPSGTTCVDGACGGPRCVPSGRRCNSSSDCASGSSCIGDSGSKICSRPSGGCSDVRDCPTGFECEASSCVDRRTPCESGGTCPLGYACIGYRADSRFCMRLHIPCSSDTNCTIGGACLDIDGDGSSECSVRGSCATNIDCSISGQVCGADGLTQTCGRFGVCQNAADCQTGFACLDIASDGVRVCVEAGGTCTQNTDCASPEVCAAPAAGGPPRCM